MGSDLNLPKSLTQSSSPPPPPPQPLEHSQINSNMPMLYYGLVVVATAAIVLAIYNLLIVRWCTNQFRRSREANQLVFRRSSNNPPQTASSSSLSHGGASSFRYKEAGMEMEECSVCLSVFEEGEEVKKLARCNHWFHAECIDMWLYSHADCPLCRAPVVLLRPSSQHDTRDSHNSRDGLSFLLDTSASSV